MNLEVNEIVTWSRWRWGMVVMLIAGLQVGGLFVFARRGHQWTEPSPRPRSVRFGGNEMEGSRFGELVALNDPTVFVDPQGRGFSDFRWQAQPTIGYQITNRTEPYLWLAAEQRFLGDDFANHIAGNMQLTATLSRKLPPPFATFEAKPAGFPARALVMVEGGLSGWQLAGGPPPTNVSSALLTNTVIRLLVNQKGIPISASMMLSSGSATADQSAIEFVRRVRLLRPGQDDARKNATESLVFGQLVFQWFPLTPIVTNNVTSKP
ncbi:MAG: hypothetical protein EXS31_09545 [Pedosphaera sp.]|nr:hypothetical protein [Pedosphaera sp.]